MLTPSTPPAFHPRVGGHVVHEEDLRGIIDALLAGYRWCGKCGLPVISPTMPEGIVTCADCFASTTEPSFCKICGDLVSKERREWFKAKGYTPPRTCRLCAPTSQFRKSKCEQCGVFHPDEKPFLTDRQTCAFSALPAEQ